MAELDLRYVRNGPTTTLAGRRHRGPLRVQKPLYPEGPQLCHTLVLHPPGGIAGGDQLHIGIEVGGEAQALLTTPGAGKWYRSAHACAEQELVMKVGAGGTAEWLPQESILFNGAQARMSTRIELTGDACFIGVDTLCFGRRASGETFDAGRFGSAVTVRRDGRLIWLERSQIDGGSAMLSSPVGLAGFSVCSTVLASGRRIDAQALSACRKLTVAETDAQFGVSQLPEIFVGRYLGHSAEAARQWFVELWKILRPALIARDAVVPRIWAT